MTTAPQAQVPGWLSAEAKSRFSTRAALVLGGLVLLQVLGSAALFAYTIFRMMQRSWAYADPAGAAQVGGRIWFVEGQGNAKTGASARPHLASIRPADDDDPERGPELPTGGRFLAADGDGIWVLGSKVLARYEAGQVATDASGPPYWPTKPFVYDERPAILDWKGCEVRMKQPDAGTWRDVPGASWRTSASLEHLPTAWEALPAGDGLDVFMQFRDDLRWRHILMGDALGDPRTWELVASPAGSWTAARLGGQPVIVHTVHGKLFDLHMQLLHRTPEGWAAGETIAADTFRPFAAITLPSGDLRLVLAKAQAVETIDVDSDGRVRSKHMHASGPLGEIFDYRLMVATSLFFGLLSLAAGAALTSLMRRHRVDVLAERGATRRFASLFQRGVAHGIDQALVWALAVGWWWRWERAAKSTAMSLQATAPRDIFVPALGFAGTWIAVLLLASWMEGRWGVTPGKWLVRLEVVGTDLAPCGFGRALIRNVLRLADGVMSFALGMGFVAFSPSWQRIGDFGARTVVVRSSPNRR